jgi:hypothetical protein
MLLRTESHGTNVLTIRFTKMSPRLRESNTKSMSNKITMYLGSMDHSPSEQLGEPDDWHTTVLLLSEAGQHFDAAKDVALRLDCRDGLLRKWSKNPLYRRKEKFGALSWMRSQGMPSL